MPLQSSSSFGRHGQRDDRRRRLLSDDLSQVGDWPASHVWPEGDPPSLKSEHYGDAEFLDEQPRLLDLAPRGLIVPTVLLVAAVAAIVGLEGAYFWMRQHVGHGGASVAAIDLSAKGSLSCWFSSLMLLGASAMAYLVYRVRRHRVDDYQGRYRIWFWAAACWFLMASDQAASLREAFRELMIALTGTPLLGDGNAWWAVLYAFVLGAIGSRLLLDMRASKVSMGALVVALAACAVAMADRLGAFSFPDAQVEVMFRAGAEMAGSLMLLAAMTLHARQVILDAEGLLPRQYPLLDDEPAKERIAAARSVSAASNRWVKVDPPHVTPQPAYRPATPAASPAPFTSSAPDPLSPPVNRKLTKGERKALKERLLRERQQRERGY